MRNRIYTKMALCFLILVFPSIALPQNKPFRILRLEQGQNVGPIAARSDGVIVLSGNQDTTIEEPGSPINKPLLVLIHPNDRVETRYPVIIGPKGAFFGGTVSALSPNAKWAAGFTSSPDMGDNANGEAALWSVDNPDSVTAIGFPYPQLFASSEALGVSDQGAVVGTVGFTRGAWLWDAAQGLRPLMALAGAVTVDSATAQAISADGSVIGGYTTPGSYKDIPTIWTFEVPSPLRGTANFESTVQALSPNGRIASGWIRDTRLIDNSIVDVGPMRVGVWIDGALTIVKDANGNDYAADFLFPTGATDNGYVVGVADFMAAFIWHPTFAAPKSFSDWFLEQTGVPFPDPALFDPTFTQVWGIAWDGVSLHFTATGRTYNAFEPGYFFYVSVTLDECPDDPNKIEAGVCGCGVPETDSDGDGVPDCADTCPLVANPTQAVAANVGSCPLLVI